MSKLEWLESFEVGVPEIDGDHRTMLALMKAVQTAVHDRERAGHYLDRLLAFSQTHFAREEILLEGWGYPGAAIHTHYHAELLKQAAALKQSCVETETPGAFEKCCDNMMAFLVDDVLRGDLKVKSFLENAGLTLAAGESS